MDIGKINNQSQKDWLIIIYSAGDNDLHQDLFNDLDELEEIGSNDNIDIVAIADQGNQGVQWKGAKILHLQKDEEIGKINSPTLENLGNVNMADPDFMSKKIGEIINKFPSKNVMVIISDHGSGWQGAIDDITPIFRNMKLKQIKEAFKKLTEIAGRKIDILGWDACLMGMFEVGYELKDYVKYMVASEQTIGAEGWPYKNIFAKIIKKLVKSYRNEEENIPENLAKKIVKSCMDFPSIRTLSAVDLSKSEELAKSVDELSLTILKYPEYFPTIRQIFINTQKFYMGYRDLGHFLELLQKSNVNQEIKEKASKTMEKLKEYVIQNYHNQEYPHAHGVSIEMPLNPRPYEYAKTDFAASTHWDEMYYKVTGYNPPLPIPA